MDTWKEFEQNVITHSAAHHLMAIDDLMRRYGYARVSDVARQLNITRGSVSVSLQPLKEGGLVVQDENRHLRLSARGQALADSIKAKRVLMQRLFCEVLGVTAEQAEIDACKMEHLLSNATAQRMLAFLKFLDAAPPDARRALGSWQSFEAECARDLQACPGCESGCLAERVRE